MSKPQPTTNAITDYDLGKAMYRRGVAFDAMTTQQMRFGWLRAENIEAWKLFEESPKQAIRFSESCLQKALTTYRPEYHFQGVDYEQPSIQ